MKYMFVTLMAGLMVGCSNPKPIHTVEQVDIEQVA